MREERPIGSAVLDTWSIDRPAPSFEDRAWVAYRLKQRRRTRLLAGGVTVAALLLAFGGWLGRDRPKSTPSVEVASGRTTWSIGSGAVAVAEDGTHLSWRHEGDRTVVQQSNGAVFYRVDPGVRIDVSTPVGGVQTRGTFFRVEVQDMKLNPQILGSAGAASAITAAALVTVYEGQVDLSDGTRLSAGDSATMPSASVPVRGDPSNTPLEDLRRRLRAQDATIRSLRAELAQSKATAPSAPTTARAQPVSGSGAGALLNRFDGEVRTEAWAARQEDAMVAQLVEYLDVPKDQLSVECRSRCCKIEVVISSAEAMGGLLNDFHSGLGLPGGRKRWRDFDFQTPGPDSNGVGSFLACQDESSESVAPDPNRAKERAQLLSRAQPGYKHAERQ